MPYIDGHQPARLEPPALSSQSRYPVVASEVGGVEAALPGPDSRGH